MTSLFSIFSILDSENKDDTIRTYDKKQVTLDTSTPITNQGLQFKNFQKKIVRKYEKVIDRVNAKEGFTMGDRGSRQGPSAAEIESLTKQTNTVLQNTTATASQQDSYDSLRKQYLRHLERYKKIKDEMEENIKDYFARVDPTNPYLNKVIRMEGNHLFYVTNQGIAKYISDESIMKKNKNVMKNIVSVNLTWDDSYLNPGTMIPTDPPLLVGTYLQKGQKLGNEGLNVYVNQMIPSPKKIKYKGCYQDNTTGSSTMTFIGGAPPPAFAGLQNGNFSQPVIKNNSYYYYNSSSIVPGWKFIAVLINNSSAWGYPMPYPYGDQAVSIQKGQQICQLLQLNSGNYTLSFTACGRNCCDNSNMANTIDVYFLLAGKSMNDSTKIKTFTPRVNEWTDYSIDISAPTNSTYHLHFQGTWTKTDRSVALQNIQIIQSGNTNTNGTYTYDMCKQAAVQGGYRYFALQNVNPSTSLGYCGVTNDEPGATINGESFVPTKQVSLWSSNTNGQTGNTAILNTTGSLSVMNTSGTSVFSTDNSQATPANYLGCYGDKSSRAMPLYSGGKQAYNLSQCQEIAQNAGQTFFGLQNSTSGTNAQCAYTSVFSSALKYGKAGNCTKLADGTYSGGGWSNAVYNTTTPESNYYLILQDDGNMCIYRGTGPNDQQGLIWFSSTNGKTQNANPLYAAAKGKYGKNWIPSGYTLASGDFVGSNSGNMALMMQDDGNLVLYTFGNAPNCSTMADGKEGGGQFANPLYDIGTKGILGNWGKVAFIDENSQLYSYPDSQLQLSSEFTKIDNYDSPYNDIGAISGSTVDQCKNTCVTNQDCYGFAFDSSQNICYPKTSSMFPSTPGNSLQNTDLYVRQRSVKETPLGVKNTIHNINTVAYSKYLSSGENVGSSYGLPTINEKQKQELEQIQTTLQSLAGQISDLNGTFNENEILVDQQSDINMKGLSQYLEETNKIRDRIKLFDHNYENVLNDSDIVVLQRNYDYMFWSILAIGSVLVAINVLKK